MAVAEESITSTLVVKRYKLSAYVATILMFSLLCSMESLQSFTINTTASLPRGLYRLTDDPADSLAVFCPSGSQHDLAINRGYRERSTACDDGYVALIKPIAARPGDLVEISNRGIAVNGRLLQNSVAASFDRFKRPMSGWPAGEYRVAANTVWLVSSYNPKSYDSRYFGPVSTSSIKHYAHPILTLK